MTKVYGASDDLIEMQGDVTGEVCCFDTENKDRGVMLVFSDGTILEIQYGRGNGAEWGINLLVQGTLFDYIEHHAGVEDDPYSDYAMFKDGLKWAYAAYTWEKVR